MSRMKPKGPVLRINGDSWTEMGTMSLNDAVLLIHKGKISKYVPVDGEFLYGPLRADGSRYTMPKPAAIYLNRYVVLEFKDVAPKDRVLAARMAILHRDSFTCQYCGNDAATIDHIIPQSKGGENTFYNLVACCHSCNAKKADKPLAQFTAETGLKLAREPYVPDKRTLGPDHARLWKELQDGTARVIYPKS